MDMLKYKHAGVVRQALVLLDLYHTANESLFRKCVDTQLLLTRQSLLDYANVVQTLPRLKLLIKSKLTPDTVDRINDMFQASSSNDFLQYEISSGVYQKSVLRQ